VPSRRGVVAACCVEMCVHGEDGDMWEQRAVGYYVRVNKIMEQDVWWY
jgi:hypothetical protein